MLRRGTLTTRLRLNCLVAITADMPVRTGRRKSFRTASMRSTSLSNSMKKLWPMVRMITQRMSKLRTRQGKRTKRTKMTTSSSHVLNRM